VAKARSATRHVKERSLEHHSSELSKLRGHVQPGFRTLRKIAQWISWTLVRNEASIRTVSEYHLGITGSRAGAPATQGTWLSAWLDGREASRFGWKNQGLRNRSTPA
jgi:hypothetical protein